MIISIQKANKILKILIERIELRKELLLQMHMASKENFLLQEIKPQVPLDSFMKIKIIFNMEDQLQEEETDQLITNKDYK